MSAMQAFHQRLFQAATPNKPVFAIWLRLTQANPCEMRVLKRTLDWVDW